MTENRAASTQKVLIAAPQPFYSDRGTPIAVRHVLHALSELGYGADVVTYPVGRDLAIPGVRYFRCANPIRARHVPIGFSLRKLALDPFVSALLWRRLRSERYAYIHAVEESAFPAVVLGRRFGVPVLYDMQSSLPEQMARHRVFRSGPAQAFLRRCEAWLLRNAELIVCSAGLSRKVREIAPAAAVREWLYPAAVTRVSAGEVAALRADLRLPDTARVVLYSGTFESYQNLGELLNAMPRVLADVPDAVLVLVGATGGAARTVARQAAALGLNGRVRVVDRQPQERVPAYLALADVLVSLRAYGGNLPFKIFDYMAAAKPIVATPNGADPALLTEDRAEIVASFPEELARAITTLLNDRDRARTLARNARNFAERHLGWTRFTCAVGEIVQTVTADPARAEPGQRVRDRV